MIEAHTRWVRVPGRALLPPAHFCVLAQPHFTILGVGGQLEATWELLLH